MWRRRFLQHPKLMPPTNSLQGYSPQCSALNYSYTLHDPTQNRFFKSYFDKRSVLHAELTKPCMLLPSGMESAHPLAMHLTMASHRRDLHSWNVGRLIPFKDNLKATQTLHTLSSKSIKMGKHYHHQKTSEHVIG